MIRHLLKLVWRRKRANALLIVEIFFSFLVFFAVVTFGTSAIMRYNKPLNFDWHDVLVLNVDQVGLVQNQSLLAVMLDRLASDLNRGDGHSHEV